MDWEDHRLSAPFYVNDFTCLSPMFDGQLSGKLTQSARIQLSERRTYDFTSDSTWYELDQAKKRREDMLKHISVPLADSENGEMIYPAQFKVTPVITITLPR